MFKLLSALLILTSCASGRYERALTSCGTKCYPQVAVSVEYNYSSNRYDKCVCKSEYDASRK